MHGDSHMHGETFNYWGCELGGLYKLELAG